MTGPAFLSKEEIREQVKHDLGGDNTVGNFNYFISTPGRELILRYSYHI